jgi:superfamily II DNA or RNA helicase
MWKEICKLFNVEPLLIINYENIKKGNQGHVLDINKNKFVWSLDKTKHLLIFDEAHRCKDQKSLNAKLMLSAKGLCKILLVSATLTDSPDNFYVFGNMLSLFNTVKQCRTLMTDIIKNGKNNMSNANPINLFLFPKYGSIMVNDKLPKNIISAICYDIDDINEKQIKDALHIIKDNLEITKIIKARQIIETIKIPIIIDLTNKYIESGKSIVIFVNFIDTLMTLSESLNTKCVIHGQQTDEERDKNIDDFQNNRDKIIILTLQSGGQSISLHDKTGHHPRVSIILPSFSSIDLIQALGRIHRSGVKSYCYQNIIFCANTHEENICQKIKNKIKFMKDINEFNDNDFGLDDIKF